jgi:hypothetical protein
MKPMRIRNTVPIKIQIRRVMLMTKNRMIMKVLDLYEAVLSGGRLEENPFPNMDRLCLVSSWASRTDLANRQP